MLEQLLTDLIAALNANTAALKGAAVAPATVTEPEKPKKPKKAEAAPAAVEPAPAAEPTPQAEPEKPSAATTAEVEIVNPTIEDLRAVGGKLVAAGRGDDLKAVLAEFGANKLSAVPADKFPEALAKLTAKLNAK